MFLFVALDGCRNALEFALDKRFVITLSRGMAAASEMCGRARNRTLVNQLLVEFGSFCAQGGELRAGHRVAQYSENSGQRLVDSASFCMLPL